MNKRVSGLGWHVVLCALLWVCCVDVAWAQDFWLVPSLQSKGGGHTLSVGLRIGKGFQGKVFGRNEEHIDWFVVFGPRGARPLSGKEGGDPAGKLTLSQGGLYLVGYQSHRSFVSMGAKEFEAYLRREGFAQALAWRKENKEEGDVGREFFSRSAKTLVWAGRVTDASYLSRPVGLDLELVPLADPRRFVTGGTYALKVLFQGQPLVGQRVEGVLGGKGGQRVRGETDEKGIVRLKLTKPGRWLFRSVTISRLPEGSFAQWESFWSSLTLSIPKVPLPATRPASRPSSQPSSQPSSRPAGESATQERDATTRPASPEGAKRTAPISRPVKPRTAPASRPAKPRAAAPQKAAKTALQGHTKGLARAKRVVRPVLRLDAGKGHLATHGTPKPPKKKRVDASPKTKAISAAQAAVILRRVTAVHGAPGPFAVAGYRMGMAALAMLKERRGSWSIEVLHYTPPKVQWSCIADGLQASTGASAGKQSLRLLAATVAQVRTVVRHKKTGQRLELRLTPGFIKRFLNLPRKQIPTAGAQVARMPQHELFTWRTLPTKP